MPVGNALGNPVTSWLNPASVLIGALAVVFSGYLAVFLRGQLDTTEHDAPAGTITRAAASTAEGPGEGSGMAFGGRAAIAGAIAGLVAGVRRLIYG